MNAAQVMNLGQLLTQTARQFPDHPAVFRDDRTWTWGELERDGAKLDRDAVLAHLEGRCARNRWPHHVVFSDSLPKSGNGKIAKKDIRQQFVERGTCGRDVGQEYRHELSCCSCRDG